METPTLRSGAKASFKILFGDILSIIYYVSGILALGDFLKNKFLRNSVVKSTDFDRY